MESHYLNELRAFIVSSLEDNHSVMVEREPRNGEGKVWKEGVRGWKRVEQLSSYLKRYVLSDVIVSME